MESMVYAIVDYKETNLNNGIWEDLLSKKKLKKLCQFSQHFLSNVQYSIKPLFS